MTRTGQEVLPVSLGSGAFYGQLAWKLGSALTVLPGVRTSSTPATASRWRRGSRPVPAGALAHRARVRRARLPCAQRQGAGYVFDHSAPATSSSATAISPERSWGANGDVTLAPATNTSVRAGVFNRVEDPSTRRSARAVAGVFQYALGALDGGRGARFTPAPWLRADGYNYT